MLLLGIERLVLFEVIHKKTIKIALDGFLYIFKKLWFMPINPTQMKGTNLMRYSIQLQ